MLYTLFSQLFNYDISLPITRIASMPFDHGIEMVNYYYYYDNNVKYYGTYEIV